MVLFLVFPELLPERGVAEQGVAPDLTLAVSGTGRLEMTTEAGLFTTVDETVSVTTSNFTGYELTLETAGATTNLVHTTNSQLTIPTIDLGGAASVTTANFPNGYGYSLDATNYKAAPTVNSGGDVLRTTSAANATADTLTLTFGAKVPEGQPSGSYQNDFLLTAVAKEVNYQVTYEPNAGEDTVLDMPSPSTQTGSISGLTLYLDTAIPRRSGYDFLGWDTSSSATEPEVGRTDLTYDLDPETANTITFYAIWAENVCPAGRICYVGNGDDGTGTMPEQTANSNASVSLIPSNFSRSGYGFAGWNTEVDGSGNMYGPGEMITTGDLSLGGQKLYATWVQSEGLLQNWTGCSAMSTGDVTALTDFRDGETYLVSKLADGNCWMAENMRMRPASMRLSGANTNNPTSDFINLAQVSASSNQLCSSNTEACDNTVSYNLNNIDRGLTAEYAMDGNNLSWYSYGGTYNWFTATAGNGTYSMASGTVQGDISPAGWRLATGGTGGEFVTLNALINNNATGSDAGLRKYPVNIIHSGDYNATASTNRGTGVRIWTATAFSTANAYRFGASASQVTPKNTYNKWDAFSIRCVAKSSVPSVFGNIHYDANGGTGTMANDTNVDLYQAAVKPNTFTKSGYVFSKWNTAADGSGTDVVSEDMVAEAAAALNVSAGDTLTLYAIWGEILTLEYNANGGTGAPEPSTGIGDGSYDFVVTSIAPTREEFAFAGWADDDDATTADYMSGDTITVTTAESPKTLYAVWRPVACAAGTICYRANGADEGNVIAHTVNSNTATMLMPSDFSRDGYGFLGWNTAADGSGTTYGTMATLTTGDISEEGMILYANWKSSEGTMQNFNGCSTMSSGDVTALTDSRDGNTYAVAKLADGKCWMMENLRLDISTATVTAANTNSPTAVFLTEAETTAPTTTMCTTNNSACFDKILFDTNNINRSLSTSYNSNNGISSLYAYGVWYNWYAATAGNGTYSFTSGNVAGDICPAGWRLPTGGTGGEVQALNNTVNNGVLNSSVGLRAYPVNMVYAGDHNGSKDQSRGVYARQWTATVSDANSAYRLGVSATEVTPVKAYNKWDAFTVRCVAK